MNVRRLGALISILALSIAAVPRITVNDKPLDVAPISENGRVLVPMRAIFEALGAQLQYDAHTHSISADGNGHAVQLQIGNPSALVDSRAVSLDVPARIVGASTYVPLRFVAQSLGAVVGYDNATSLVTVALGGTTYTSNAGDSQRVGSMLPAPNSTVGTGYPTISAVIGGTVPVQNASLSVDGVDVTDATTFDGTTMTYIPQQGLAVGTHEVAFTGVDQDDVPFSGTWSFTTSVAPAPDFGNVPFQFYLENGGGIYGYGDEMNFVLEGPPGGRAYLTTCASSQRIWLDGSGSYYRGSLRAPYGLDNGYCPIEAVYIGWNGQIWYAPVPIIAHLRQRGYYGDGGYGNGGYYGGYNGGHNGGRPHNRPTPTPSPNHWPPKPTPSPNPQQTPHPHQPWPGQTPAPPVGHPPHRPAGTPMPEPAQTQAPRPEPVATQPPQPQATQAPPQARPPRRPRPEPTEAPAPAPERTDAPAPAPPPAPAQTDAPAPAQTDAPAPPPPPQPEPPHVPEPRPERTPPPA